jgi:hypothetical protein
MAGLIARFNDIKEKNPGMSDSDAMEQAMKNQEKFIKKVRESDKKKREKIGWIEKLKMGATKEIAKRHLSKAGKAYRKKEKTGEGRGY